MKKDLSLYHLYREAEGSDDGKKPVIFLVHGYGSQEDDLFSFAADFPDGFHIVAPRAPLTVPWGGYAWYSLDFSQGGKHSDLNEAIESREKLAAFIKEATEAYNCDPERVCLMGFSQGAILSYAIMSYYPALVQRYIPVSGYLFNGIINTERLPKEEYKNVKALATHGTMDEVIPYGDGKQVDGFMAGLGVEHVFLTYRMGHTIAPKSFPLILDFIKNDRLPRE